MPVKKNLSMQLSGADKKALQELARVMQRSQSDVLRILIRSTWSAIQGNEALAAAEPGAGAATQSTKITQGRAP